MAISHSSNVARRSRYFNSRCTVWIYSNASSNVRYKRKKIFGTDALREVSVDSDTTAEIKAGLLFYHYRLGLGVVEEVNYLVNKIVDTFAPETTDAFKVKYLARRAKSVRVRIRFLHGIRTMSHTELFVTPKGENLPRFYSVTEPDVVAGLF